MFKQLTSQKKKIKILKYISIDQCNKKQKNSVAGTWTRVFRVRAEYPDQLDYNGFVVDNETLHLLFIA